MNTLVAPASPVSVPALSPAQTVIDVLLRFPHCASVFNALGVDSCCGGAASLADAAVDAGIDVAALLAALEAGAHATHRAGRPT